MAFPTSHYYLAWSGTLPGAESFSMGVRLSPEFSLSSEADEKSALTDYAAALSAWWIQAGNRLNSTRTGLVTVKLNRVGTDGKYQRSYTNRIDYTTPKAGATSGSWPNQIAWVTTLETGAARGLAHRGRLFWPCPSVAIGADGVVTQADALVGANLMAGLVNSLNAVRPGARVHVYSSGSEAKGLPGTARAVTGVTVGRVLDTVRTRRRQLAEARVTATTTVTP